MTVARFLQIHTLHSYSAALLNRDDSGLAKRMTFGDAVRTRISSQCLKRHWRKAEDDFALKNIEGFTDSMRTRNAVSLEVMSSLKEGQVASPEVLRAVEAVFQEQVYSNSGTQPLLLGFPEVKFLSDQAKEICSNHPNDVKEATDAAKALFSTQGRNFRAFREQTRFPGGLISALFGRMVTSDTAANVEAAVHVAHSFTVHKEESEIDFWAAVEDLPTPEEGQGAAHLNDMELTAGLFYGYVVVDVPGLVSNLQGCPAADWQSADRELAGQVMHHLIQLIATVSPGAKRGSTAPYGYADLLLVEAGARQPRSLANAFRQAVKPHTGRAVEALAAYLDKLDGCYGANETRRVMSLEDCAVPHADRLDLNALASWAADAVRQGEVA